LFNAVLTVDIRRSSSDSRDLFERDALTIHRSMLLSFLGRVTVSVIGSVASRVGLLELQDGVSYNVSARISGGLQSQGHQLLTLLPLFRQ
jgi:hypothetical protein